MATHVINRTPNNVLSWKTPCEILYGKKSDLSNLKVFGCLRYSANIMPFKDKLDKRAMKCVFIGYNPSKKAYKLYDLNTHKVFVSRDVKF